MAISKAVRYFTEKGTAFDLEADAIQVDKEEIFTKAYLENPIRYKNTQAAMGEKTNAPAGAVVTWLLKNTEVVGRLFKDPEPTDTPNKRYYCVLACVVLESDLTEYEVGVEVQTELPNRKIRKAEEGETPSVWGVFETRSKQLVDYFGTSKAAETYCQALNTRKELNVRTVWGAA